MLSAFLEFSPERFAQPAVIAGLVLMIVGLLMAVFAGKLQSFFMSFQERRQKDTIKNVLEQTEEREREGAAQEVFVAHDTQEKNEIGKAELVLKCCGIAIVVAGALLAVLTL